MNTSATLKNNQNTDERRAPHALIVLGAIAAVSLIILALILIFGRPSQATEGDAGGMIAGELFPGTGESAIAGHLPNMTEEQVQQQMQRVADESKFSFKINAQPVFENGRSEGTLRIENPGHNVYPMVVEIFLEETGEKLYYSGGILPDHHIDTAKLLIALPRGSHPAQATINAYDPETGEYQGRSIVNLTMIVKS